MAEKSAKQNNRIGILKDDDKDDNTSDAGTDDDDGTTCLDISVFKSMVHSLYYLSKKIKMKVFYHLFNHS